MIIASGQPSGRLEGADITRYILAGNARFTVRNALTGNRFTFRMRASDDGRVHFVSVLAGDNNEDDYRYIGYLRGGAFFHGGKKSFAKANAASVICFGWFWRHVSSLPAQIEVWHDGRCGRCGRTLTVPESVRDGIGPECATKLAVAS